jgi:hypothetical protein
MSGRAQYSRQTNRALYSGVSGNALYNPLKLTLSKAQIGTRLTNICKYDVVTGQAGKREDVYPSVLSNLTWSWSSYVFSVSSVYWESNRTSARHVSYIFGIRTNTSAYKGMKVACVRKRTKYGNYEWWQGGGYPMISIRTAADSTPGNSLSWVEGTHRVTIPNPTITEYCQISPESMILDNYFWCFLYIDQLRPPTSSNAANSVWLDDITLFAV